MARSQAFLAECPAIGRERSPHATSSSPPWRIHRGDPERRAHDHRRGDVDHPVRRLGAARADRPGTEADQLRRLRARLWRARFALGRSATRYGTSTTMVARTPTSCASPTPPRPGPPLATSTTCTSRRARPATGPISFSVRLTRRPDDATRFSIEHHPAERQQRGARVLQNLSMTATDPRFVLTVINGRSAFIDKLTAAIRDHACQCHRGAECDDPATTAR